MVMVLPTICLHSLRALAQEVRGLHPSFLLLKVGLSVAKNIKKQGQKEQVALLMAVHPRKGF